jgi:hypothetical protein
MIWTMPELHVIVSEAQKYLKDTRQRTATTGVDHIWWQAQQHGTQGPCSAE